MFFQILILCPTSVFMNSRAACRMYHERSFQTAELIRGELRKFSVEDCFTEKKLQLRQFT